MAYEATLRERNIPAAFLIANALLVVILEYDKWSRPGMPAQIALLILSIFTLSWTVPQLISYNTIQNPMARAQRLSNRRGKWCYRGMILAIFAFTFMVNGSEIGMLTDNEQLESMSVEWQDIYCFAILGVFLLFMLIWMISQFLCRDGFGWAIVRILRGLYQITIIAIVVIGLITLVLTNLYEISDYFSEHGSYFGAILIPPLVVWFFIMVAGEGSESESAGAIIGAAMESDRLAKEEEKRKWEAEQADREAKEAIKDRAYEKYGVRGQVNRDNTAWRADSDSDWQTKI